MIQTVNIKLKDFANETEGILLKFELPKQPSGSIGVNLTPEQAQSLAKIIRAKYGDK